MKGLLGRKLGMTQIFNERGEREPVTVIEAGPVLCHADPLGGERRLRGDSDWFRFA